MIIRASEDLVRARIAYELRKQEVAIDPLLPLAIISIESTFDPKALRYEPNYIWLHETEKFAKKFQITESTMVCLQKFSVGLSQQMLATSYWLGFNGHISDLFDPATNIHWMIRHLKKLSAKYPNEKDLIVAYNAGSVKYQKDGTLIGSSQEYLKKVLPVLATYRRSKSLISPTS